MNPFVTGSTPLQTGAVTYNGVPARHLIAKFKGSPGDYYRAERCSEHAPYTAHRGDVAIVSYLPADLDGHVEGGQTPFVTAFNGASADDAAAFTRHFNVAGVVVSDTPDDYSADVTPAPVALQIGGIATVRNTGSQTIKAGDIVAVRLPVRGQDEDWWHVTNPAHESARGVIRAITYPMAPTKVSIPATMMTYGDTPPLGSAAEAQLLAGTLSPAGAVFAGLTQAFVAGLALAPYITAMHGAAVPVGADAQCHAMLRLFGLTAPAGAPLFPPGADANAARNAAFDMVRHVLLPSETRVRPGAGIAAVRPNTVNTLSLLAMAVSTHGRGLHESTLGLAKTSATRGKWFDIQLSGSYML
jgi:hypothetical protein